MAYPLEKANLKNCLLKRGEQIERWKISDTNKENHAPRIPSRVKFRDGIMFLAACSSGDVDEVLRLLVGGADINTANVDGITALHQACIDNNGKIIQLLLEHGANINVCDNEGWTPLHATSSCGFIDLAQYLIDHGARLDAVNNDGDLPVDVADGKKFKSFLTDLMEKRGIRGDLAKQVEEQAMIRDANRWISSGHYDERPHPKTGAVALHIAAAKGYTKVIKLLLDAGADINASDIDGWTPMHAAAHWGQGESCQQLSEHMASLTVLNKMGQTPIDIAASEIKDLLEELLKKQSSTNVVEEQGLKRQFSGTRRSSIIRMSSDLKKDLITKTADKDVGLGRTTSVEEGDEVPKSDDDDEPEDLVQTGESSGDSSNKTVQNPKDTESSHDVVVESVPAHSYIKQSTDELRKDKLSVDVNRKTDIKPGALSASNKAVSLESISHCTAETGISSGSSTTVSSAPLDSKTQTSFGLVRDAVGGSDKNISERTARAPLSSSSFRLSRETKDSTTTAIVNDNVLSTIKLPLSRTSSSLTSAAPGVRYGQLLRQEPLQRRPYTSVFTSGDIDSKLRPTAADAQTTQSSYASVPSVSKSNNALASDDVATTSAPAAPASSILAQLSYAQPSIELLRRRQAQNADHTVSSEIVNESYSKLGSTSHGHLLSSATVAALTVLANTPRRSFDVPKRDEDKEVERRTKAKRARESRRSTQGVTKEDLAKAEEAMQEANTGESVSMTSDNDPLSHNDLMKDKSQDSTVAVQNNKDSTQYSGKDTQVSDNSALSAAVATDTVVSTTTSVSSSSVPYSRMSSYRSKYLQDKEQSEEARQKRGDVDLVQLPETAATDDEKNEDDPSQKLAASRARRKRDRRSTGKVLIDDTQVLGSDDDKDSITENSDMKSAEAKSASGEVTHATSTNSSAAASRLAAFDIDYKRLYEIERSSNEMLRKQVHQLELDLSRSKIELEAAKARHGDRGLDRNFTLQEKKALERKIVDLEEQIKMSETLKADNQRLKDENGALIRVISKLSK